MSWSINCDKAEVLLPFNFLRAEGLFSRINQMGRFGSPPTFPSAIAVGHQGIKYTCKVSLVFIGSFLWPHGVHGITSSNLFILLMRMPGSLVTADSSNQDRSPGLLTLRPPFFPPYRPCCFPHSWLEGTLLGAFLHVLCSGNSLGVSPTYLLALGSWLMFGLPCACHPLQTWRFPPVACGQARCFFWAEKLGCLYLTGRRFYGVEGKVIAYSFRLGRTRNTSPSKEVNSEQGYKSSLSQDPRPTYQPLSSSQSLGRSVWSVPGCLSLMVMVGWVERWLSGLSPRKHWCWVALISIKWVVKDRSPEGMLGIKVHKGVRKPDKSSWGMFVCSELSCLSQIQHGYVTSLCYSSLREMLFSPL